MKTRCTILTIFAGALSTLAASTLPAAPGDPLHITAVHINEVGHTLTILGEQFLGGSDPFVVHLGQRGDITSQCLQAPTTATTILCKFTPSGFPPAGDYRLTVSKGTGTGETDQYDLTIGAVGPQGPQGPPGAPGSYTQRLCTVTQICACAEGETLISGGAQCQFPYTLNTSYHSDQGPYWLAICVEPGSLAKHAPRRITILCYDPTS
jgi:hypothetical protein